MPLKRKLAVGAGCAPSHATDGSRFVECPVCSRKVAHYLINSHLDYECGRSTSLPADATAKFSSLPPAHRAEQSKGKSHETRA